MSDWQPIETAPHDWRKVLVWDGVEVCKAVLCEGGSILEGTSGKPGIASEPDGAPLSLTATATHWMPLPEPPAEP